MTPRVQVQDVAFTYPQRSRLSLEGLRPTVRRVRGKSVLDGVSLTVAEGETLAIIGANGCGKSTLVKLLARALYPQRGSIRVEGSIAALVELGAGFDTELSVHDNILLNAALNGHRVKVVREAVPEILAWADLVDVEWEPVRTLSSGMTARLGFAVATQFRPDVLLVDEVLSVGDARFKERSAQRMGALVGSGAAVVVVTHDMEFVRERADTCLWIDQGRVRDHGSPERVVADYVAHML